MRAVGSAAASAAAAVAMAAKRSKIAARGFDTAATNTSGPGSHAYVSQVKRKQTQYDANRHTYEESSSCTLDTAATNTSGAGSHAYVSQVRREQTLTHCLVPQSITAPAPCRYGLNSTLMMQMCAKHTRLLFSCTTSRCMSNTSLTQFLAGAVFCLVLHLMHVHSHMLLSLSVCV